MKNLLIILISVFCMMRGNAQYVVPGRTDINTLKDRRQLVEKNFHPPVYNDTTQANLDLGVDSIALIVSRDSNRLYMRVPTGIGTQKKWVLTGSTPTPPPGSNRDIPFNDNGVYGATSAFQYSSSGFAKIQYGGLTLRTGADNAATTITSAVNKVSIFSIPHYLTSEEDVIIGKYQSFSGTNSYHLGFGDAGYNAMNDIRIGIGATATTITGTEIHRWAPTGAVHNNSNNNYDFTMKSVNSGDVFFMDASANAICFTCSTPTALVHLGAGTATKPPFKFTSAGITTTPQVGAMGFHNGLWFIDSSNTVRDTIAGRRWIRENITSGAGLGSVTSVATNTGTGITGGTITSTGTIAADTSTVLSTRAWVAHIADSLATALAAAGSGTVISVGSGYGLTGGPITTSGTLRSDTSLVSTKANVNHVADSLATVLITGAGGANQALSNLASVSVNQSLIPQSAKNLGAASTPWKELFLYGVGTYGSGSFKVTGETTQNREIRLPNLDASLSTYEQSYTNSGASDAVPGEENFFVLGELSDNAANRTLTMPTTLAIEGRHYYVWCQNTSPTYHWTFAASSVKDWGNNTVTSIGNEEVIHMIYYSGIYLIVN